MENYDGIRKLVDCELEKISKMNELNTAALDNVGKLVDILKDLDEIENDKMDDGYSQRYNPTTGNSYMRGGRSYGRSYGYNRSYNSRGGSLRDHLEQALDEAKTDRERETIMRMMDEM